jgi:hypothetical protein
MYTTLSATIKATKKEAKMPNLQKPYPRLQDEEKSQPTFI